MSNSLCLIEGSDRKTRSGIVKEEEMMEDSMHNNSSNMDLYDQQDGDGELQYNVSWIWVLI